MKTTVRRGLIFTAVVIAVIVLVPFSMRRTAMRRLNETRKKLIASGEKLSVAELKPKTSINPTNSDEYQKMSAAVYNAWKTVPNGMLMIKPGVARLACKEEQCIEEGESTNKPEIDAWIEFPPVARSNEAQLTRLAEVVNRGGISLMSDYGDMNLLLPFLAQVKDQSRKFTALVLLDLHERRGAAAVEKIRTGFEICDLLADEPLMINQLVRQDSLSILDTALWEGLNSGEWDETELAQLQSLLEKQNLFDAAANSLSMERARIPMYFEASRQSRSGMIDMFGVGPDGSEAWNNFLDDSHGFVDLIKTYPRYWGWCLADSYDDERRYDEGTQQMMALLRSGHTDVHFNEDWRTNKTISPGIRGELDSMKRFADKTTRCKTAINLTIAACALERYRIANHKYPGALAELQPAFLKAIPADCCNGQNLRYRLNDDAGFLLYSVGSDGVDNGGDPSPAGESKSYFLLGRDLVWPRVATSNEVQEYLQTKRNERESKTNGKPPKTRQQK